jgi:hypothetical protein
VTPENYREKPVMEAAKYVYWQDEDVWLGYLERYPDYWTQGETVKELEENLRDIYWSVAAEVSRASQELANSK